MFNIKKYYEKKNAKKKKSYNKTLREIRNICKETACCTKAGDLKEYSRFFHSTGKLILKLAALERQLNQNYFRKRSFQQLARENKSLFREILSKNYKKSYANPTYCMSIFGEPTGQLLSYFYCLYRQYIGLAFHHLVFKMEKYNRLFVSVYRYISNNTIEYETLKKLITDPQRMNKVEEYVRIFKTQFDPDYRHIRDIPEKADLTDLRYLFRYGKYITDNEINTARFLLKYPIQKLKKLSNQIVNAYITGSIVNNTDISKKSTVLFIYNVGQELLARELIKNLKERKMEASVMQAHSANPNRQFGYDHRFDDALYLDKSYTKHFERDFDLAGQKCKRITARCSGIVFLEQFGEPTFIPENKQGYITFAPEQQQLFQMHQNNVIQIQEKYFSRRNIAFTIISLPSPEVGKHFEKIFEDILEINMLETEVYEPIQQIIINTLDKARYIHIKGKGRNRTDIRVHMQKLKHPSKHTNFVNCGADVNIPLGEVYTTPQLKGTQGILHFEETYLGGLKFSDLTLTFKDGYIVDYNCKNFKSGKDNKKYVAENLLFPHQTLPMGEFAIGTNTLAYVIAKKHNIISILPILIIEKMGPHFAIGDTCFAMSEDKPIFNKLDKKEVVARDNEKTVLRKTKIHEAYTQKHQDITLPYESIQFITAVTENGAKIDIIRNERFVLKGTEFLNEPFKKKR